MKKTLLILLVLASVYCKAQNVGVGTTTPHASAQLDISSSNKGVLIPRITTAQRNVIASPANGLMVYDITSNSYWYYRQNKWQQVGDGLNADSTLQYGSIGSPTSTNLSANISLNDSSGIIYDSGGPAGNYGNNQDYTVYVNATGNPVGCRVQILNNTLELPYDSLWMYKTGYFGYDTTNLQGVSGATYTFSSSDSYYGDWFAIRIKTNNVIPAAGFAIRYDFIYASSTTPVPATPQAGWYFVQPKLAMHGGSNFINGWNKDSVGLLSFSYGQDNKATGNYSFAAGHRNIASGNHSSAMGWLSKATANISTAIGLSASATGDYSTAIGLYNNAIGYGSTALGDYTVASGVGSTSVGYITNATGDHSTAMGHLTTARAFKSMAIGTLNDSVASSSPATWIPTDPLFIIGNGTTSRSNALVVYKNGNTDINGYVRLGESSSAAPRIKTKKLTGTSAATQNNWVNISHGLTQSKIISVNIIMTVPGFVNVPPSYRYHAGYEYDYQVAATNIVVVNSAANSSNILNKNFTILITYEE